MTPVNYCVLTLLRLCVGGLLKKWNKYFMSLDEEGTVLRWWKNEDRKSSDSAVFMK